MNAKQKDILAARIAAAWAKYAEFFGQDPHGTLMQIRAMLELMPNKGTLLAELAKSGGGR